MSIPSPPSKYASLIQPIVKARSGMKATSAKDDVVKKMDELIIDMLNYYREHTYDEWLSPDGVDFSLTLLLASRM